MLGFCVASRKRAQLISRCRHFHVQQPEHSTPSSATARKSCFPPSFPFFFFLHFSSHFSLRHWCALTKFSLRVLEAKRSPPAAISIPLDTPTNFSVCLQFPAVFPSFPHFHLLWGKTMGCGFFSFWFLSYFFCARILQIIGLVSLRVQCLLALFSHSPTPPTPGHYLIAVATDHLWLCEVSHRKSPSITMWGSQKSGKSYYDSYLLTVLIDFYLFKFRFLK